MTTHQTSSSVIQSTSAQSDRRPVAQADRIQTLDILRGVALLGILLINIPYFALNDNFADVFQSQSDPATINFWVNTVITILFEGKMRALFSMIFGVGIILFITRKEQDGPGHASHSATGLFFRRMGWLVLFGLIDSHLLLWAGDILYFYGLIGMIAFWFRAAKPIYLALSVPLIAIMGFVLLTLYYGCNYQSGPNIK